MQAERGYVIPAWGTQYETCARVLADSLHRFHPKANVTIVTQNMLPHGDLGGFANDWQLFEISPYRQTIKLEADMLVASEVDHWWTLFELRDVVISQTCRNLLDQPATSRSYRACIDANHLPDVYNAITYWRLSRTAQDFFGWVRRIFENWTDYARLLRYADEQPTTDVVYAMAAQIMGPERVTLPLGLGPSIVHMKPHHLPLQTQDWTKEFVWEKDPLRINTIAQWGFVHYQRKEWANEQ